MVQHIIFIFVALLQLSALEIEKLNFSSLFGIDFHCKPVQFSTQVSDKGPSWSSCLHKYSVFKVRCVLFNQPNYSW